MNLFPTPSELLRVTATRMLGGAVRVLLLVLGLLLLPAAPASAHSSLVSSTPEGGAVLRTQPSEIVLTFNEPITALPSRTQVLAPDGKRISESVTADDKTLRITLRKADRPLGTYLVSYRIISGDSHPVGNALIFSVGAPSARPAESDPGQVDGSVTAAVPTFKFLGYAGLTLAIGPALFLALLWPRRQSRTGAVRLVHAGLGLTAVSTLGSLWAQAPYASGAPLWNVSFTELGQVLSGGFGLVMLARLALVALAAGLIGPVLRGAATWWRGGAVVVVALLGLTTWPLTGHAVVAPLAGAIVAADVVHLGSMAVWLGGLVTLAVFLLRRRHQRVLGVILPAWSRWATLAVVWLAGAGLVQAVVQVGSVPALWQTGYGRLIIAKAAILAGVLAVAAYARALVRTARVPAAGPARLIRTVGIELTATTAILALSAVLVGTTPGSARDTEPKEPVGDGVSQTLTSNLYTLQFNIYPVEIGEWNTVHGSTYTPEGKPIQAAEWTVTTRYTGATVEAVKQPMLPLPGRNDALGSLTFPLAGTYELTFTIRTTEIDQATVRTTVNVPAIRKRPGGEIRPSTGND
ncbi:copper resistance CopC/CopD family protein [Actinoplanes sp. NPDC049265]|uniref:copper resistance CopC/CopD family protein n=1 Tax=Actinoplanes sp. NPDC049265 TaxID=3363902 RepID=UPI0037212C41